MPDLLFDLDPIARRQVVRWTVCESSGRWATAIRRFAPQLVPPPRTHQIVAASHSEAIAVAPLHHHPIILWEVQSDSLAKACDWLTQTARNSPQSLQLVACAGISDRQRIALAELPVAAFVRHPEDLPRLRWLLLAYFARDRQLLD